MLFKTRWAKNIDIPIIFLDNKVWFVFVFHDMQFMLKEAEEGILLQTTWKRWDKSYVQIYDNYYFDHHLFE